MIRVIMIGRQFGHDRLRAAVALAVAHGACDLGAVRYLLTAGELRRTSPAVIEVGSLAGFVKLADGSASGADTPSAPVNQAARATPATSRQV